MPGMSVYSDTKAAARVRYTRTGRPILPRERTAGIRVNAVCPGTDPA